MLVIRFSNAGRRGERKYNLVVAEKRSRRDGRPVENLGFYEKRVGNTVSKSFNEDRIKYWVSQGAQMTRSVKRVIESAEKLP